MGAQGNFLSNNRQINLALNLIPGLVIATASQELGFDAAANPASTAKQGHGRLRADTLV